MMDAYQFAQRNIKELCEELDLRKPLRYMKVLEAKVIESGMLQGNRDPWGATINLVRTFAVQHIARGE